MKNAGAVILGKTNLHEFAYGGSSSVSYFGVVHNPWALDRVPGGSSGGSAAATAFDLCVASLGTDTAGSVRIPAAYCGIVGLKPTYGRVSHRGVVPLSWTLDHVGPLCKSVEDAALMLAVMAGFDERDPTVEERPVPDYRRELQRRATPLRLGVVQAPFFEALDPEIAHAIEAAIGKLREAAASIRDVQLPPTDVPFEQLYAKVRSPESYAITRDGSKSRQRSINHPRANGSFRAPRSVQRITLKLAGKSISCGEASKRYSGLLTY